MAAAAALAAASDTPRMALAPSRPLFGVPSSAISVSSILACASASMPPSASKISPLTASTALRTPLPPIARLVAVAQLDRLVRAGRGAGRHGGAAARAVLEDDVDFDGRIAAAIEDFAADNVGNGGHGVPAIGISGLLQDATHPLVMSSPERHALCQQAPMSNGKKPLQLGRPSRHPRLARARRVLDRVPNPHARHELCRALYRAGIHHACARSPASRISRIWSSTTCPPAFWSS